LVGRKPLKMIVGLGNPGSSYAMTRHSVGFLVMDLLSRKHNIPLVINDCGALTGQGTLFGQYMLIVKPLTYMNKSGNAVLALHEKYEISSENILVVHDDIDIPFGNIKVKTKGGSAGHRGVDSIIACLKTGHFTRIRIGIGTTSMQNDTAHFVLDAFSALEQKYLKDLIQTACDCIQAVCTDGAEVAMNIYHSLHKIKYTTLHDTLPPHHSHN